VQAVFVRLQIPPVKLLNKLHSASKSYYQYVNAPWIYGLRRGNYLGTLIFLFVFAILPMLIYIGMFLVGAVVYLIKTSLLS
jgi:hypothetical protein